MGDRNGVRPLHYAAISGNAEIAEALLKHKAATDAKIVWALGGVPVPGYPTTQNFNSEIPNGATPLWLAINHGRLEVAELLLSYGAPVNARVTTTIGGRSSDLAPLEQAVQNNNKEMIKLLLERKANPNVYDINSKHTPLMLASANSRLDIVELLLAHGAEVNVLANESTPLSLAQRNAERQPPTPASKEIVELLLKHGAIEDLPRSSSITVARGKGKRTIFQQDTNNLNRFTLFEAIAQHYAANQSLLTFPDFSRVKLKRLKSKAPTNEMVLDLDTAFKFADCTKDQWLEWGDLIEIPELDHRVNEGWFGLSDQTKNGLIKCVTKKVRIIVKGQTNAIVIRPVFPTTGNVPGGFLAPTSFAFRDPNDPAANVPEPPPSETTFQRLNELVRHANVIRSSSDLTRVKVRRTEPVTGEKKEMVFDLTSYERSSDLWLRDVDVIEIPEKQ